MSKLSDERATPDNLFKPLDTLFEYTLDPAATKENTKCKKFFTIEDNGLKQSWYGNRVFLNPPYSRGELIQWVYKCANESENAFITAILPGDTSTKSAQIVWETANIVYFPKGRFKFNGMGTVAKFATMIALYGIEHLHDFLYHYDELITDLESMFKGKAFLL
jgi:site-specific DNA-methyltransferase (adenine-specific)